jgi:hypothetical protein
MQVQPRYNSYPPRRGYFGPTERAKQPIGTVIQLEYAVCCSIAQTSQRLRNAGRPIVPNSTLADACIRHQIEPST